jgi:hypothetical protein
VLGQLDRLRSVEWTLATGEFDTLAPADFISNAWGACGTAGCSALPLHATNVEMAQIDAVRKLAARKDLSIFEAGDRRGWIGRSRAIHETAVVVSCSRRTETTTSTNTSSTREMFLILAGCIANVTLRGHSFREARNVNASNIKQHASTSPQRGERSSRCKKAKKEADIFGLVHSVRTRPTGQRVPSA